MAKKEVKEDTWMKGLKIIPAEPANSIDIYAMLKDAVKDGVYLDQEPSEVQLSGYYLSGRLIEEIMHPSHNWIIARRGKQYLGCLHSYVVPGKWSGDRPSVFVDVVHVKEEKRKMGIGKKLIDELMKWSENINIKQVYFLSSDDYTKVFSKKRKAKKVANHMRIDL